MSSERVLDPYVADWLGAVIHYDTEHETDLVPTLSACTHGAGDFRRARTSGRPPQHRRLRIYLISTG